MTVLKIHKSSLTVHKSKGHCLMISERIKKIRQAPQVLVDTLLIGETGTVQFNISNTHFIF